MTNPKLPKQWTISNGESAEKIAREWGLSRDAQDEFAVRSHRLAAKAWADGVYDGEI
ncbi:3-oxoadipyl-CoA thiolase, partial [Acinetobacter baumannii]